MMRSYYIISKAGSLKYLKFQQGKIPQIKENQVLVEVKAVGLNYADIFAIMGLYSATPKGPFIPGLEFSGVVRETRCNQWRVGDPVIGVTKFGGYNSHIVADPAYLMPLPQGWSFEQGAAFPVQTLTAYYAIKPLGNLQQGQTVLIHSAAGGVGLQANRVCKKFGAFTIGVVGHGSKLNILKQEGFDKGIVRGKGFRKQLDEALEGRALNLVLETTGSKYFYHSYNALAPMGRLVAYGSAQFTPSSDRPNYLSLVWRYLFRPRVDPLSMIPANKSVMGFNLIWIYEKNWLMQDLLKEIEALQLPAPKVGHQLSFNQMHEALRLFKSGSTSGKVVLSL